MAKKGAVKDLLELQRRLNELIKEVVSPSVAQSEKGFYIFKPLADVSEDDKAYYVEMELPGVEINDVEILCENRKVSIKGERKFSKEIAPENVLRMERYFGNFLREFSFSSSIDKDNVEAKLENGILSLFLPKKEGIKKIPIK